MSKAEALKPRQINKVLEKILMMQDPETKRAAMVLSHAGLRVSEVARLDVKTLLFPSGMVRTEVFLPAKICKGTKSRTIWLSNKKSRKIIQEYIDYRHKRKWGLSLEGDQYQGLNPDSKLLYNNRGRAYSLSDKIRKLQDGTVKTYKACDALEDQFRKIYIKCGLRGCSSHTGRKSIATNAANNGVELDDIARLLGHSDPEMTLYYIQIGKKELERCYEVAY